MPTLTLTLALVRTRTLTPPLYRDRPNVVHDAMFTTLSTGPFGIGDMLGCTNASLVAAATRADGVRARA